jgi:hypothetical protein
MTTTTRPKIWVPGDWNAFFGFGTNILVNLLTLTALLRFVLKMPDSLVFGRILPATGLMLCLSTLYYASLAYRLAEKTGRSDVCALPSGVSVPHMFVVTFVIMLPIALAVSVLLLSSVRLGESNAKASEATTAAVPEELPSTHLGGQVAAVVSAVKA